jgi:hypothetical protein
VKVGAVHEYERRPFAVLRERSSGEAVDRHAETERVGRLALDNCAKVIELSGLQRLLPPLRLKQVMASVEREGSIDLFVLEVVRRSWVQVVEREQAGDKSLEPDPRS